MANKIDDTGEIMQAMSPWLAYRRAMIVVVHLLLWSAAFFGAFLLRFDFAPNATYWHIAAETLPAILGLRLLFFWQQKLFHGLWRYTGSKDLGGLFVATSLSSILFVVYCVLLNYRGFPRSIFIIEWLGAMIIVGGLRFGIRKLRELSLQVKSDTERRKVLIVGAGDAGEMLLRELQKTHGRRYKAVGFVDDDPSKHGMLIHGTQVRGPVSDVPELVEKFGVEELIIAIPTATGRQMRRIVQLCKPSGIQLRTIPGIDSLIEGHVTVTQLRDVAIEDLLGRAPIDLDLKAISEFIEDRVVLVTGAGGSIGSELCRQVCRFKPKKLVLVEQSENHLFEIHREIMREVSGDFEIVPAVADITDKRRMDGLFGALKPSVVLHAAAHKHVPMMEYNPGEAVKNNCFGTRNVANLASQHGVDRFVMISTDKAVNPTSVMGTTKRVAELYIQALSRHSKTRFVTVRFGNVLGSSGSVIPIFREQIQKGGPVTVTHPEMKRYFMTIPEACQLVLEAGTMGEGGEIFVLDMGEPMKIVDLAHDLIVLSGLVPGEDIDIEFSGVRPGEKLFEELSLHDEKADKTKHPKIFVGSTTAQNYDEVEKRMLRLKRVLDGHNRDEVQQALKRVVPEFTPTGVDIPEVPTAPTEDTSSGANVIPLRR